MVFGWFKKKEPAAPSLVDRIWLDRASAERAMVRAARAGPLWVVAYFDQTQERVRELLRAEGLSEGPSLRVERADQLSSPPPGAAIIVAERHPVTGFNSALAQRLSLLAPGTALLCFTGLDDALMNRFGDGRLPEMMKRLGLSADEPLDHPMISKALANASQSLEKRIGAGMSRLAPAASMAEWLQKNVPPA